MKDYCTMWRGFWVAVGIQICNSAVVVGATGLNWDLVGTPPMAIDIHAEPIPAFNKNNPEQTRFGQLEYRGGLILTSPYKEFGGLSAIRLMPDLSRFISLSDHGRWLQGRIVYDGSRPVAIDNAVMAPMLGPDGEPLAARGWHDTESIADDNGTLYVGIERVNQIVRFDYGKDGLRAHGEPIPVPKGIKTLPSNLGLESLVFVPRDKPLGGTLIAISERGLDPEGNILGFLIGGPTPGTFAVRRSSKLDISDASLLPNGDLLILERSVSWPEGLLVQIRRIAIVDIKPGAVVDGTSIFNADLSNEIDNFEGLDVKETAGGETILTLISDNNFLPVQRTELLQFKLMRQ
jgi:hypothetical protein